MSNTICSCDKKCINFNAYGYNCFGKDENDLRKPCGVINTSLYKFRKLVTDNKIGDCKCKLDDLDYGFCECGLFIIHSDYNENIYIILSNFLEKWNDFKDLNDNSVKCIKAKFYLKKSIIV